MKTFLSVLIIGFVLCSSIWAQDFVRKEVMVPKVDPAEIVLDGVMDEDAWGTAAHADLITDMGYEIWANKYYRESLAEPDYDELYGRMLWANDTLYVFIHIDEFVNDSTDLFWDGPWTGDQLFISLSARLAEEMMGWYDGNVYRVPEGPYHFLVLGEEMTLNNGNENWVPEKYRCDYGDSLQTFDAANYARWGTYIDKEEGVWNVEAAIYNPHVTAQSCIAFNIGGSTGSDSVHAQYGDAYAYYTWQPSIPDDPYGVPASNDPGYYNLASSSAWAMLHFQPGPEDVVVRKEVEVPWVDPADITIDGMMDETVWGTGAHADLVTDMGYEIWANKYYREALVEPDYDELYGRMLWTEDTLYVFVHIDEFVNDTTNLFWDGPWVGDQLFVSLSSRLAEDLLGWYDGNVYRAPEGPYHYLVLGDDMTLNNGVETYIPEQFRCNYEDSTKVFNASNFARWATFIDKEEGVWNIEAAIHNPNVAAQACLGFNLGGSSGSDSAYARYGDAYAYYTWQPSIPDDPYGVPASNDPGYYNLASSSHHAVLMFKEGCTSAVEWRADPDAPVKPASFTLEQNFPNPFNPSTTIRFQVTKNTQVNLKVYNALGQVVAVLIDAKPFAAGRYLVSWKAADFANGVYYYSLEADGFTDTKKMILLK
ncbi:T9SS type A sorting domain-containing protein [candidate division KSB1 bacterium]|nr:T9SS type A sorting domain-containing protein [candidate division KSB1 bacterium]